MKSIFNNKTSIPLPYPKMMKNKANDTIILFTDFKTGVLIHPGSSSGKIGEYRENWNSLAFEDFHGNVVIHSE